MLVSIKKISKFPSQIPCSSRPPAPRPSSTRFKEVELSTTLPSFLVGQVLPNRHGPPKVDRSFELNRPGLVGTSPRRELAPLLPPSPPSSHPWPVPASTSMRISFAVSS